MTLVDKRLLATTFVESVVVGGGLTRNITDPANPIIDLNIATQAEAEVGTNNTRPTTPLRVAQAIAKLSPPTDIAPLALAIADLQGSRFSMKGGIADAFDDETGIFFTQTMIPAVTGIAIGDMTVLGGLASAFNGVTAEVYTNSARSPTSANRGFIGKDWGSGNTKTLSGFKIWAPTNTVGFEAAGVNVIFKLKGSNSVPTAWDGTGFGGTTLFTSPSVAGPAGTNTLYSVLSGLVLGAYRYNWIEIVPVSGSGSEVYAAEVQFFESSSVSGSSNQLYDAGLDLYTPFTILGTDQTATHTAATTSGNTVSASTFLSPFDPWKAFDKVVGGTAGANNWITNVVPTGWLQYQFGSAKTIGSYTIRSGVAYQTRAPLAWTLQGSNTGAFTGEQVVIDTRIGQNGWASGGTVVTYTVATPGSYTYYRLNVTANNGDSGYVQIDEVTLIAANTVSNMTLVSNSITAASVPTSARVNIQIDYSGALTPNTDFSMEVSRDGGVTYTAATLTLANSFGTIQTYENTDINITAQPSGTSMVWRFKTLTNKNIPITGVILQWK